jgi:hypothetical protein
MNLLNQNMELHLIAHTSQAHWLVAHIANALPKPAKELAYPNAQQIRMMQQIVRLLS